MLKRLLLIAALLLAPVQAFAAITYQWANYSNLTTANTSNTFNVGSTNANAAAGSVSAGTCLVAFITVHSTSSTDTGVISVTGFTTLIDEWSSNAFIQRHSWVGWRCATGSETASYAASWTNAGDSASWALIAYTGVDSVTTPLSGYQDNTSSFSSTFTSPSVTPTATNDYVVAFFAPGGGNNGTYSVTAPLTLRVNVQPTSSVPLTQGIVGGDVQLSASGATGTYTATASSAGCCISNGFTVALHTAAAAATTSKLLTLGVGDQ